MSGSDRGQTTLDFAIGAGIFLLAVTFTVMFIPGLLDPFHSVQTGTIAADRIASQLAGGGLGNPATPSGLYLGCTAYFFGGSTVTGCHFSGTDLHERIGLSDRYHVNIRIQGDTNADGTKHTICVDDTGSISEMGEGATCAQIFEIGGNPPTTSGSVAVARRTISISGARGTLLVRVW